LNSDIAMLLDDAQRARVVAELVEELMTPVLPWTSLKVRAYGEPTPTSAEIVLESEPMVLRVEEDDTACDKRNMGVLTGGVDDSVVERGETEVTLRETEPEVIAPVVRRHHNPEINGIVIGWRAAAMEAERPKAELSGMAFVKRPFDVEKARARAGEGII
jgi:hypothetical protein